EENGSLPYASSLCGACYDVCPVKINIPEILVHLRGEDVEANHSPVSSQLDAALTGASWMMSDGKRMAAAESGLPIAHTVTGGEQINSLPGIAGAWTSSRDIPALPEKSFRQLWAEDQARAEEEDDET
ncbi:MAG: (4Fe-4S)-binding protein, partial [Brevibacterium aurantiacum]